HVEDRYLLQVMPAFLWCLVLIVAGFSNLVEVRLPEKWKRIATVIPLAFVAVFLLSYGYRLATQVPEKDSTTLARGTARWLETQKISPAPIVAQTPDLAFFSGVQHVWMPAGEPEAVIQYAKRNGARYIYVSSQDVSTPLNELLLGNNGQIPASLRLLHEE